MTNEIKPEPKNKKADGGKAENKPAHLIRDGAIAASIWLRESSTGFPYYEYTLSRSYKSVTSGKSGYLSNYFARNEKQLINVIQQASQWISEKESQLTQAESLAA